eukprot:c4982_g1_i2.p1 GENE.c4982_g1_i2~~c4982_g1_i2.p1  ORF type:complete len:254 (+),score=38.11 c4982_g1_i2:36-797(+)
MTNALYLQNTYQFSCTAQVTDVKLEDGVVKVALNQTVFHPQGGGQPSDVGSIRLAQSAQLKVNFVSKDQTTGVIWHSGELVDRTHEDLELLIGTEVLCEVNEKERLLAARLHSGGHLIDIAVAREVSNWKPTKGYHFKDGAYVEYEGNFPEQPSKSVLAERIQAHINELTTVGGPVTVLQVAPKEAIGLCAPFPLAEQLQSAESVRLIGMLEGNPMCPCAGTHVQNLASLQGLKVLELKKKGKAIRVRYEFSE